MINIGGKQIKLQIWDTVRVSVHCGKSPGMSQTASQPNLDMLSQRSWRRPARNPFAQSHAHTTAELREHCLSTTSPGGLSCSVLQGFSASS